MSVMKQYLMSLAIMMAMMCSNLSAVVAQNNTSDGGNSASGKVKYPCWEKGFKLRIDADITYSTGNGYLEQIAEGTLSLDYQINTLLQAGVFAGSMIETFHEGVMMGIPVGLDVRAYAGRHTRRIRLFYAAQVGVMVKGYDFNGDVYYDISRDRMEESYDGIPCSSRYWTDSDGSLSVKPGYLFTKFSLGFECRSGFHLGIAAATFGIDKQIAVHKEYYFNNGTSVSGKSMKASCTTLNDLMVGLTAGWNISITRPNRSLYK